MIFGYVVVVHGYGKGGPPFYTSYLEGLGGKQVEGQRLFPVATQDDPSHYSSRASQSRKDKKEKKEYPKQMSEMAKIVQQQRLENKKLENFSQILKDSLSSCLKLSVSNKRILLLTRVKNLSHQRSLGIITRSPEEQDSTVLGYADVSKFLLEVNGVFGSLCKVFESNSEAHLYLEEHFVKEHPTPSNVAATDSPPSFPEGGSSSPPAPPLG
jgi:hypothetical protein